MPWNSSYADLIPAFGIGDAIRPEGDPDPSQREGEKAVVLKRAEIGRDILVGVKAQAGRAFVFANPPLIYGWRTIAGATPDRVFVNVQQRIAKPLAEECRQAGGGSMPGCPE